jgi:hypothetical protein
MFTHVDNPDVALFIDVAGATRPSPATAATLDALSLTQPQAQHKLANSSTARLSKPTFTCLEHFKFPKKNDVRCDAD